jgi:DMSO/TMAO reductase YedYZ heme-binding membrane subunit
MHALWYATRGTGLAALILLTAVVATGIAGSLRLGGGRWPRFLVAGLHRNLTLLTLVFLAGHIATTVLDTFTPIHLIEAFVPFIGRYRPIWLGLGAVAFDLLLALTVTSLLRARLGHRAWRTLHWLAYAAWPVAVAHGLGTGSDARFGWTAALTTACVLTVLAAVAARLAGSSAAPGRRLVAGAGALALVGIGAVWYDGGPAAAGWAKRAGTPSTLLGHGQRSVRAGAAATHAQTVADVPSAPFSAQLDGRLTTVTEPSGLVRIDIRGRTSGGTTALLWIRLEGQPDGGGGVSMHASGVRFGPTSDPNLYVGSIDQLSGTQMSIGLRDASGRRLRLAIALTVDEATSRVTGTLHAVAGEGDSE